MIRPCLGYSPPAPTSRSIIEKETEVDEDIFSSMLTAIQEFVQDSFREVEDAPVKRIDFGSQKIMIERGKDVYLAVVYTGNNQFLDRHIERAEAERERGFFGVLADGAEELLSSYPYNSLNSLIALSTVRSAKFKSFINWLREYPL